jgi:hypothetical protein
MLLQMFNMTDEADVLKETDVHLKKSSNLVNLEFTFLPNFLYCSL